MGMLELTIPHWLCIMRHFNGLPDHLALFVRGEKCNVRGIAATADPDDALDHADKAHATGVDWCLTFRTLARWMPASA